MQKIIGYLMMRYHKTHIILHIPIAELQNSTLPPLRSYFKWQISHQKQRIDQDLEQSPMKLQITITEFTQTKLLFIGKHIFSPFTWKKKLNIFRKMKHLWGSVVQGIRKILKLVAWYLFLTMFKQLFQIVRFYHIVSSTPY